MKKRVDMLESENSQLAVRAAIGFDQLTPRPALDSVNAIYYRKSQILDSPIFTNRNQSKYIHSRKGGNNKRCNSRESNRKNPTEEEDTKGLKTIYGRLLLH